MYAPIVKQQRGSSSTERKSKTSTDQTSSGDRMTESSGGATLADMSIDVDVPAVPQHYAQLSPKSREQMSGLVQLRHWLSDTRREAGHTVDLSDIQAIKEAVRDQQNLLDQLKTRRLELIRILEDAHSTEVQNKAEILSHEWERAVAASTRRKRQLSSLAEEARLFDRLKATVELWLTEGDQLTMRGAKVTECSIEQLHAELLSVEAFFQTLDDYKVKMNELNQRSNALLDTYQLDDGNRLSHETSEINTAWSKFND
uniref:Dystrophin-1-like spectrin repeat domain-containing protein n=1 Tax=Plectus sambesii TaxID=2011161 RepID=A0A914V9A5_9BILA